MSQLKYTEKTANCWLVNARVLNTIEIWLTLKVLMCRIKTWTFYPIVKKGVMYFQKKFENVS